MAEIINLRAARKARARVEAEKMAAANRALHGRTKAQKQQDKASRDRTARAIDGAQLEGRAPVEEND